MPPAVHQFLEHGQTFFLQRTGDAPRWYAGGYAVLPSWYRGLGTVSGSACSSGSRSRYSQAGRREERRVTYHKVTDACRGPAEDCLDIVRKPIIPIGSM